MNREAVCYPASGGPADEKRAERDERGRNRQPARSRDGEAEKHDVAGHVGNEYVAKVEKAGRVDEPGDDREQEQKRR